MPSMPKTVDFITLGCAKNLVDTEYLMRQLSLAGYHCFHNRKITNGEIVVVNTCGFIGDAQEESIRTILSLIELKKRKKIEKILVMGCLSERFKEELHNELPEVDALFGKFDGQALLKSITGRTITFDDATRFERTITTGHHSAYLKISEGCDRTCAYCAIPLIVGKHISRPMQDILQEAQWLANQGVKELNVIAQDICYYGYDRYGKQTIAELVERIAQIDGLRWIRLHYAYPTNFPMTLLDVMKKYPNICHYLDIPFQHCSDRILTMMRRNITAEQQDTLLENIRSTIPNICLRTTLMVGHPGETQTDFEQLIEWVQKQKFDRLGVFTYCEENGTFSQKNYHDDIPQDIKNYRKEKVLDTQELVVREKEKAFIGKKISILVDEIEKNYYLCRSEFDSPEVDGEVLVDKSHQLQIGEFYDVEIYKSDGYCLYGRIV